MEGWGGTASRRKGPEIGAGGSGHHLHRCWTILSLECKVHESYRPQGPWCLRCVQENSVNEPWAGGPGDDLGRMRCARRGQGRTRMLVHKSWLLRQGGMRFSRGLAESGKPSKAKQNRPRASWWLLTFLHHNPFYSPMELCWENEIKREIENNFWERALKTIYWFTFQESVHNFWLKKPTLLFKLPIPKKTTTTKTY